MAQRQGKVETVRGKTLTSPLKASEDEVMLDPVIKVTGLGYVLDKADYLILTRKVSFGLIDYIGASCLGLSVAYVIEIITNPEIESWKNWALGISLICAIICFLVGCLFSSEKKKLLKRIKQHLESQPKTVESHRKDKS